MPSRYRPVPKFKTFEHAPLPTKLNPKVQRAVDEKYGVVRGARKLTKTELDESIRRAHQRDVVRRGRKTGRKALGRGTSESRFESPNQPDSRGNLARAGAVDPRSKKDRDIDEMLRGGIRRSRATGKKAIAMAQSAKRRRR